MHQSLTLSMAYILFSRGVSAFPNVRSGEVGTLQPRTQALSTTRLAGGKTLVQAGHVSPRFWEITKFLHEGGGLSFILPT